MKILITGATGKLGSKVVETLLETVPANQVAVSVRDVHKADAIRARGVDVRHGDFDHPDTLDAAFAGVERLLIISTDGDNDTRTRQHRNAVAAAERAWDSSRIPASRMSRTARTSSRRRTRRQSRPS